MHAAGTELVGESAAIRSVRRQLPLFAKAQRTTLITGPTGSGKEVVAAGLHAQAYGTKAPYVAVHCGALPEQLVEAELFGHTRGAFTGAVSPRDGLVRSACGGTLFLDEIDSLSPPVQSKLLRFLESRTFRSIGSDRVQEARVWVLAATNRDLRECVAAGEFREDLLYRLDVMHLHVPPLRLRGSDIELLARHFLNLLPGRCKELSPRAVAALYDHDWPGNVRELKHRIERAAILAQGPMIEPVDLELAPMTVPDEETERRSPRERLWQMVEKEGLSLSQALARCERMLIESALAAEQDNRTRAAQRLGIHVRTIFKKLAR